VAEQDVPDITKRILEALEHTAEHGFPTKRVESVLHLIELGQKHVSTDRGLGLGQRMMQVWMHGGQPLDALRLDEKVGGIKLATFNKALSLCVYKTLRRHI
jgi:Zn-dependent M16 (insulinase) family peptidase